MSEHSMISSAVVAMHIAELTSFTHADEDSRVNGMKNGHAVRIESY